MYLSRNLILSDIKLPLHLIILTLLLPIPITSSPLTGPVLPPYSMRLHTHAKNNLLFAPNGKPLLIGKAMKSLNLNPSTTDLSYNTVKCTLSRSYCIHKDNKTFPQF